MQRKGVDGRRGPSQKAGLDWLGGLDITDGFVDLASDDARKVTGTELIVDGGLTAGISRYI